MGRHRSGQPYLPIKTLGDLAKPDADAPLVPVAPPFTCSRCGGPLEMRWDCHARGMAWANAKCPACGVFFVRRTPARTAEEWGWREDPDPPAFVRGPEPAEPGAAADGPRL